MRWVRHVARVVGKRNDRRLWWGKLNGSDHLEDLV